MDPTDRVRLVMRVVIAGWFILINLFILIPSWRILSGPTEAGHAGTQQSMTPPVPPSPVVMPPLDPKLPIEAQKEHVSALTQQVNAYTQQVSAYSQQLNAYKAYVESAAKSDPSANYKTVVSGTLVPILNGFIAAFLGWVFANIGVGVAERLTAARANQARRDGTELPRIRLL